MNIREALPRLFYSRRDVILAGTPTFTAAAALGIHRQSIVVERESLTPGGAGNAQVLGGYQVLKAILHADPKDYLKVLYSPCASHCLESVPLSFDSDLSGAFAIFEKTKFGYTAVDELATQARTLLTIRDAVGLLENGTLSTDLTAGEVATPIFPMPKDSALKDVLKEMFARHHRRVFVSSAGGKSYVASDRQILNRLFAPDRIREVQEAPLTLLDLKLGDVGVAECEEADAGASLKSCCQMVRTESECVVCGKGVVTPWDLIMKPWKMKRLNVGNA